MNKLTWKRLSQIVQSRQPRERLVLLGAALVLIGYAWLLLGYDRLAAAQAGVKNQTARVTTQILDQSRRIEEARLALTNDPKVFARRRLAELQAEDRDIDARLNNLYGRLISPTEMSRVLAAILRRETSLRLVSLQNIPPAAMVNLNLAALPAASAPGSSDDSMVVYKHGMRLEFEGDFLETLDYLRSLEALETKFFWESLDFQLLTHPRARITLEIFTLSTQRGFIGV